MILFLCVSASPRLIADDIQFSLSGFTSGAVTNRQVLVTPLSLYPPANRAAAYDPVLYGSGPSGAFIISNMIRGLYRADIQAPPARTTFFFFVETNGTGAPLVSVDRLQRATPAEVRTPQDYAFSAQASDARYLKGTELPALLPGLNVVTQNAAAVTLRGARIRPLSAGQPSLTVNFGAGGEKAWQVDGDGNVVGYDTDQTNVFITPGGNAALAGTITAARFVGDGSQLTGLTNGLASTSYVDQATNAQAIATTTQLGTKITATGGMGTSNTFSSPILTGVPSGLVLQLTSSNWIAGRAVNVVFAGDSITSGGIVGGVYSWPYYFTNMPLWSAAVASSHNTAVSGSVLDGTYCANGGNTITNRLATDMGYKSNGMNNVWFCFIGANDYIGPAGCGTVPPDPVYWCGLYDQVLYKMKTNGWTTVVFTIIPRGQGSDGWDNTQTYGAPAVRERMNQVIRWGLTNADVVVDTAAVLTDLRTNLAFGNVVMSVEGVHPNNLGGQIIARLVDQTLRLNYRQPRSSGYLGNAMALGQAITNVAIVEGTAGTVLTNFNGNQFCIQQPAGSPETLIFNSLGGQSKVLRNSGTYGGTGNTWYDVTTGGSSSTWAFGIYTGSWTDLLIVSNTGAVYFEKGTTIYRNAATTPPVVPAGSDGVIWNSNKVAYWVTATKTNLVSNGCRTKLW